MRNWIAIETAIALVALLLASAGPALADPSGPLTLRLKGGVAYDDNVSVSQNDTNSGVGDRVVNLEFTAGFAPINTQDTKLSAEYTVSQSLYAKLPQFDLQSHDVTLSGSKRINQTTLSGSYAYYHILLDGKSFLDMQVVDPSLLTPVSRNLYVRAAWFFTSTTFRTESARNAAHNQPEAQLYYFFNRARGYVLIGADYQRETTSGPEFTFKGYELKSTVRAPVRFVGRDARVTASYAYLRRDYDNITPFIGARRREDRSTLKLGFEIPLSKSIGAELNYSHIDRRSNLRSINYMENVIGASLVYRR